MNTADKVINTLFSEDGYLEKATNKYLDDKFKNAGSNNWTKYGRDMTNNIGSPFTPNAAWCCTLINWAFYKTYGKDTAKSMLGGWTAYCPTAVGYYKNMGRWYTSKPQIGDQIFFKDTSGTICHTGLVYKVDSSYVYTIEGNTSSTAGVVANGGCVRKKSYTLNYSKIAGYGRPKYDSEYTEGWVQDSIGWWYRYKDGTYPKSCWKTINGRDYYFKADGYMASNEFIKSANYTTDKKLYYVNTSGEWDNHVYYWKNNNIGWWIESEDDKWYAKSSWAKIDQKWYWFNERGYMVTGKVRIGLKTYTFNSDGALIE